MKWTTISLWLLSPLTFSACVSAPATGRAFDAPPERVRAAVRACLSVYPEVVEDGDRITTGWGSERVAGESLDYARDRQGVALGHGYRYRDRYEVVLAGGAVGVRSSVVRRAPGGPRANRWERVDPTPAEKSFLEAVAKELEKAP